MKYTILVKTNKKQDKIYWKQDGLFGDESKIIIIETKEPPIDGRANKRIIELMSDFLQIPQKSIFIKTGKTSKLKTIVVLQN